MVANTSSKNMVPKDKKTKRKSLDVKVAASVQLTKEGVKEKVKKEKTKKPTPAPAPEPTVSSPKKEVKEKSKKESKKPGPAQEPVISSPKKEVKEKSKKESKKSAPASAPEPVVPSPKEVKEKSKKEPKKVVSFKSEKVKALKKVSAEKEVVVMEEEKESEVEEKEVEEKVDEEEEEDHLHGFSTDDDDSSDDDTMNDDCAGVDVAKLPTIAKDDATVKRKLEQAKRQPTEDRGVLFIGRIPHGFYEDQLKAYFSQFGEVTRLRLSRNKKTGKSKHYGFIEFDSSAVAKIVADTMDNYLLMGHILRCKPIPKDEVHPELWIGANQKWRPVPRDRLVRVQHNKPRSEEQKARAASRLLKRQNERKRKLQESGIKYDIDLVQYKKTKKVAA